MITYVYGELFYSPAKALINPVNTVGIMSSGLSHDFKRFFPDMYEAYRELCHNDKFSIGQLLLYRSPHKIIVNMPTRKSNRASENLEYIEDGLKKFVQIYADQGITSASFPAFGMEDGELAWSDVRPIMEAYLAPLPISIYVHLPEDNPPMPQESRNTRTMRHWLNGLTLDLPFEVFWRDCMAVLKRQDDFVTFFADTQFHVIMTQARGRQRLSLKLSPKYGDSIFITESQLRDIWQYIKRVGYVFPQNMPSIGSASYEGQGEELASHIVISFLANLPYLRAVRLGVQADDSVVGLHYVPPIEQKPDVRVAELTSKEA